MPYSARLRTPERTDKEPLAIAQGDPDEVGPADLRERGGDEENCRLGDDGWSIPSASDGTPDQG